MLCPSISNLQEILMVLCEVFRRMNLTKKIIKKRLIRQMKTQKNSIKKMKGLSGPYMLLLQIQHMMGFFTM